MRILVAGCVVACAACHAQVSQDHATGPDGVIEGARPIAMVDNVARATGTVSYPYGDRVDWFVVEVPDGLGEVGVEVDFRPAKRGLRAKFDLWNDNYERIRRASSARHGSDQLSSKDLPGRKLYLRIYAVDRRDAGSFSLAVTFKPVTLTDWTAIDFPDPPSLPAVPEVVPVPDPPPSPPPPPPPPPRCPGAYSWDPATQRCVLSCLDCGGTGPIATRILKLDVVGAEIMLVLGAGSDRGVAKDWTATLVRDGSGAVIPGGDAVIVRVDKRTTVIKAKVTPDVAKTARVRLAPPVP